MKITSNYPQKTVTFHQDNCPVYQRSLDNYPEKFLPCGCGKPEDNQVWYCDQHFSWQLASQHINFRNTKGGDIRMVVVGTNCKHCDKAHLNPNNPFVNGTITF